MKLSNKKSLFQLLCETRKQIIESNPVSPNIFKIYSKLTWLHDMFMIVPDEQGLKDQLQNLSLSWTERDEENFNCLKLLRMKSFGTI